ncbi:MAG: FIVAR domain-containing protein, partial [Bifidobacteriaceae bacterium]|nr:FIVAR domain-containing protein [Bifidobacteriaceae bacterium]
MKKRLVALATGLVLAAGTAVALPASADPAPGSGGGTSGIPLRPVEYLDRGLVAAELPSGGVFLSWRFLGNEPDGLSWNVYRDDGAGFAKIATIAPRDVAPESNYATNPGIVKENTTPSNYTDPAGTAASVYEVAPLVNGVEYTREGMTVPMLTLVGSGAQAGRGAAHYIPLKPAPTPVLLPRFVYRGYSFGPGGGLSANNMVIPGTSPAKHWYEVDMDLLKEFRQAWENQATVTQADLNGWVARLNAHNTVPNNLGNAVYPAATWTPSNALVAGRINNALYNELEAEFIKYVENLDCGKSLPIAMNGAGTAVDTRNSANYQTQDMTTGDFDGDGRYEIVVKWRGTQTDPMYSEPIYSGTNGVTAPEYVDVYTMDGDLLFRVDTGYNVGSHNDHENNLMVEDFDSDGKSELMLKTGLGTRIGNWDASSQTVVYPDTLQTVVGGQDGLASTTAKFQEYFQTGNVAALNTYWSVLSSFAISLRSPTAGGGNDGPNDPAVKRWIKTYHVGPMGAAKDNQEFMSAFEWDPATSKGVLVPSAAYPHTWQASVDGETWAMTPCTQRGNYAYLAFPGPGIADGSGGYKAQVINSSEAYWLTHPWKNAKWGDAQGNRANRYLASVAALDGVHQYAINQRGYYHRTTFAAFRIENGQVVLKAAFDSADPQYWSLGGEAYDYQNRGNHHTATGDIDGDGRDEIVMSAMVLELSPDGTKILPEVVNGDIMPTIAGQTVNNVTDVPQPGVFQFATDAVRNNPLNVWAPLRHGDRGALLPADKTNKIVQFTGSEEHLLDDLRTGVHSGWIPGPNAHDPLKGRRLNDQGQVIFENSLIYGVYQASDDEGSVAGNYSNRWPGGQGGTEATNPGEVRSLIDGSVLATGQARGIAQGQYAIWFGGGLTAMAAAGANVNSVNDLTFATSTYLQTGMTSTGNKGTTTLKADMFGDWREELILRASNNRIGIVTTLSPTDYGIRTLMHDGMYRDGVADKNAGYDQFGFASFYLGDEAPLPAKPAIEIVNGGVIASAPSDVRQVEPGTPLSDLNLPTSLDVTVDTGVTRTVPVTWNAYAYDPATPGVQTLTGTLGTTDRITNPAAVTATIQVQVAEPEKALLVAMLGAARSLNSQLGAYTANSVAALSAAVTAAEAVAADPNATEAQIASAASGLRAAFNGLALLPTSPPVSAVLDALVGSLGAVTNTDGAYSAASWTTFQNALTAAEA